MIRGASVTFNFDTETGVVTDVKCVIDGTVKKTRTTKTKTEVVEEMASEALITLDPTKLIFNNKAVAEMELSPEDRIVIKWETKGKGKTAVLTPTIGKDLAFDEEGAGNKVTKTFTVGYKGKQNAVLAEFGTEFGIESYKDGIWKLVSKTSAATAGTLEEVIEEVEKEEPVLIISEDENIEIDELTFQL